MTRQEYMLAVIAAGEGDPHGPTQVQTLFFLLDRKVPQEVGGSWFNFVPDAYGPFDVAVFEELKALATQGLVLISKAERLGKFYHLTTQGRLIGQAQLSKLPPPTADYVRKLSAWVRALSFEELVTTIFRDYPEMRVNAVFQGAS